MKKEFSKPRLILDTGPLVKLFIKEEGWENVENILLCIENGKAAGALSVVSLAEIYCKYLNEGKGNVGKNRIQELRFAPYLEKLGIHEEIAVKAGEFKSKYSIPMADALIAASAFFDRRIVISDDAHFKKIAEIKTMTEKELVSHLT